MEGAHSESAISGRSEQLALVQRTTSSVAGASRTAGLSAAGTSEELGRRGVAPAASLPAIDGRPGEGFVEASEGGRDPPRKKERHQYAACAKVMTLTCATSGSVSSRSKSAEM